MTLQPDSAFFHTIAGGLAAHVNEQYGEFLLWDDCFTNKDKNALLGSVVLFQDGGWGYVPLNAEAGLPFSAGVHRIHVRRNNGATGKDYGFSAFIGTAQAIIPGILSSSLNQTSRHFDEGTSAAGLRFSSQHQQVVVRVVVQHLPGGKLELQFSADDGSSLLRRSQDASSAFQSTNIKPKPIRPITGQPPQLAHESAAGGGLDIARWVKDTAARSYETELKRQGETQDAINLIFQAAEPARRLLELQLDHEQRLDAAGAKLNIVGYIKSDRKLAARCFAAATGLTQWADHLAEAMVTSHNLAKGTLTAMVTWVESCRDFNDAYTTSVRGQMAQCSDEGVKADLAGRRMRLTGSTVQRTAPIDERRLAQAPATPGPRDEHARMPNTQWAETPAPQAGNPAWATGSVLRFVPCVAADGPLPTAGEWLRGVGGADVASAVLRTHKPNGVQLVTPGTERAALQVVKALDAMASAEFVVAVGDPPSTIDFEGELWTEHRPADHDDAAARLEELLQAVCDRRANLEATRGVEVRRDAFQPAGPQPFGAAEITAAVTATLAATARTSSSTEALGRRAGEIKPALASATQSQARTVCSSAVTDALGTSAFIESERALGTLADRGETIQHETRRASDLPRDLAHACAAFVASDGVRPADSAAGIPSNVNQLRQAIHTQTRDACEVARGGPERRGLDESTTKAVHLAANGLLVGALDFAGWVKLFGGRPPAQRIETFGGEGAGRDGDARQHADIERALRFWARMLKEAHGILLGLNAGPAGDYGVEAFIDEVQHTSPSRIMRVCDEFFGRLKRQYIDFRTRLDAPSPDPRGVLTAVCGASLHTLQMEQLTVAIASKAAADADKGKSASAERVQRLEAELKSLRNLYGREGLKRDLGTSAGESRTRHSTLDTRTRHSTLDTRHSTLDPRPSTLDPRPSTLNPQPSALGPRLVRERVVSPRAHNSAAPFRSGSNPSARPWLLPWLPATSAAWPRPPGRPGRPALACAATCSDLRLRPAAASHRPRARAPSAPSRIAPRQREPHRGLRTVLSPRRSTPHLRLQRLTSRPLPPVVAIARPVTATIAPRAPVHPPR